MSKLFIEDTTLTNIADAIRGKLSTSARMTPEQMATKIGEIQTGGGGATNGNYVSPPGGWEYGTSPYQFRYLGNSGSSYGNSTYWVFDTSKCNKIKLSWKFIPSANAANGYIAKIYYMKHLGYKGELPTTSIVTGGIDTTGFTKVDSNAKKDTTSTTVVNSNAVKTGTLEYDVTDYTVFTLHLYGGTGGYQSSCFFYVTDIEYI